MPEINISHVNYTSVKIFKEEIMQRFRIPFTQFPPMITSYKTIVQNHSQDIDIDAIKMQNTRFPHIDLFQLHPLLSLPLP